MSKILIVDDSDVAILGMRKLLESAGYSVIEGCNGADGIKQAKGHRDVRLIISDLSMPEMDGLTMIRQIRLIPEHAETPVFMLSVESTPDLKKAAKEAKVMMWIIKPYVDQKVLDAVAFAINQKAAKKA